MAEWRVVGPRLQPRARAKGAQGRPRRAPSAPQAATAGAFGVGEASDEVTVRGQLPVLSGSHRALRTCCTSAVMDLWVRTYRVKAAAQKRRRITLLLWYAPPAPDQAQGGLQPRPASASLGQLADIFRMAGRTGLVWPRGRARGSYRRSPRSCPRASRARRPSARCPRATAPTRPPRLRSPWRRAMCAPLTHHHPPTRETGAEFSSR